MNGWLTSYSARARSPRRRATTSSTRTTGRARAAASRSRSSARATSRTASSPTSSTASTRSIAKGLVDKAKVGITGGSYGGYLSAWAATKWTDRFAAAVVFVGVTDQVSKRLCTDIPMEDYLVHWKIWTDENQPLVWDRSPIAHAKGSKTPTLICHGKDDPRVNPVAEPRALPDARRTAAPRRCGSSGIRAKATATRSRLAARLLAAADGVVRPLPDEGRQGPAARRDGVRRGRGRPERLRESEACRTAGFSRLDVTALCGLGVLRAGLERRTRTSIDVGPAKAGGPGSPSGWPALLCLLAPPCGCGKEPAPSAAAHVPFPAARPATQPSGYRINPALPHGSIAVSVRARARRVARVRSRSLPTFRARNPRRPRSATAARRGRAAR